MIGPTGYSGFELLKILFRHPRVKSPVLFVREKAEGGPRNLSDVYPQISGNGTHSLEPFSWARVEEAGIDLLFLATPHEFSREFVPEAIARGVRVIDLSGAWRLKAAENRSVYGFKNEAAGAKLDEEAVYGLPELNSDNLANAQLVANPGCYPTSIILALAPFIQAGCVDKEHGVICDSKSGVSGAGKAPTQDTHFVEVADNFRAYKPVDAPASRRDSRAIGADGGRVGIYAAPVADSARNVFDDLRALEKEGDCGAGGRPVEDVLFGIAICTRFLLRRVCRRLAYSLHTNYCDIGFALSPDGQRLTLFSCIDNLVKGASGQAVQNMNVMYGWCEKEGLS